MIWHIFRKDWHLLWQLVAIVALVHATAAVLWWLRDHGIQANGLDALSQLFPLIAFLGSAILSISAIHADPLPADREDWLTRPIRRSDLLAAKLLFVLLAVVVPVFAISVAEVLLDGFSFVAAASAALGRSIALLILICLPAMVLGAITRNATEAIMAALTAGALAVALLLFFTFGGIHPTLNNSGLTWWGSIAFSGIVIAAALIVLPLQYRRRSTALSRLLVIPFFLLALQFQTMPWNTVFSAQQSLPQGDHGDRVTIGFDPSLGRSPRTAISAGVTGRASLINLPIRVDGVAAGDVLLADNAEIRLLANGQTIYHQASAENSYSIPAFTNSKTQLRQVGASNRPLNGYQAILLPMSVLNRVRTRDLTLEIDYSLSLFHKDATATLGALDDSQHVENIGWCTTGIDDDGDEVQLRCVLPGQGPNCISAMLENPVTKQHDPETFVCEPDYSPVPIHFIPDDLTRMGLGLKFQEFGNAAKYPVGKSQLKGAHVVLTPYQPTAHFTRHIVIRDIHLDNWEAPANTTPAD